MKLENNARDHPAVVFKFHSKKLSIRWKYIYVLIIYVNQKCSHEMDRYTQLKMWLMPLPQLPFSRNTWPSRFLVNASYIHSVWMAETLLVYFVRLPATQPRHKTSAGRDIKTWQLGVPLGPWKCFWNESSSRALWYYAIPLYYWLVWWWPPLKNWRINSEHKSLDLFSISICFFSSVFLYFIFIIVYIFFFFRIFVLWFFFVLGKKIPGSLIPRWWYNEGMETRQLGQIEQRKLYHKAALDEPQKKETFIAPQTNLQFFRETVCWLLHSLLYSVFLLPFFFSFLFFFFCSWNSSVSMSTVSVYINTKGWL